MKMLGVLVLALVGMAGAQAKRPMTFEDLMAMKRVSDPQVSPSGKWVLFSVTDVSLKANTKTNHLWVVPVAGGKERQVTFGDGEGNGRFSPDGKFISLSAKGQIYEMNWNEADGSLANLQQVTNTNGGADGAIWSPDSKRLLFVVNVYPECSVAGGGSDPTHRGEAAMNGAPRSFAGASASWAEEDDCDKAKDAAAGGSQVKAQVFTGLLYRHWNAYTGERRSHVAVVDADTGRHLRDLTPAGVVGDAETPTFSLGGPLGYAWAPDSHEIAYVTNLDAVRAASTNNDVFTLRLDEAGAKAVKVSTSPGSDDGPQYSPDGKWLAFRSQARAGFESDRFRLMLLDRKAQDSRELSPNFDRWVDEFQWATDSKSLFFLAADRGEQVIFQISLTKSAPSELLPPCRPGYLLNWGRSEFGDLRVAPNGRDILATQMSEIKPNELIVLSPLDGLIADACNFGNPTESAALKALNRAKAGDPSTETWKLITHVNDRTLTGLEIHTQERFVFAGAEGAYVEGFLVKPPNFDPAKKYPVKFLIHGGPQGAWGDAWSYRWNPELMAASGYVVVMVNPRGSTGYGQAFVDGVSGDWGGKAYVDLMKGLDAAEAQFPFIDKSRECALGASYGGYMANWILTHTNRFKCIVTHDGMYNPVSAYGTTEELWFNEWEFRRPGDTQPGQPWRYASLPESEDPFRKWSPALHIQDAKTPTLVIHGQKDYRLDVSEGFQLFTALQRLGVPSKMLYFSDEGHWVMKPQNSELWNKTVSDWCDQWTHTNAYAGK